LCSSGLLSFKLRDTACPLRPGVLPRMWQTIPLHVSQWQNSTQLKPMMLSFFLSNMKYLQLCKKMWHSNCSFNNKHFALVQWLMPMIPVTQEADIRIQQFKASWGKKSVRLHLNK
jgi:hypothetical protein